MGDLPQSFWEGKIERMRSEMDERLSAKTSRIAELERERDGLKIFIDKQAAAVRALQRRLGRAGLDAQLPGKAEREN